MSDAQVASLSSHELKCLVEQANAGDAAALEHLRKVLDDNPQIWQRVGDVAKHAELLLIQLAAGEDRLLIESLQRNLDELKAQLGGSNPSPLERLAVERVTCTWLQVQLSDVLVAKATPSTVEARFLLKRQGQSDRAYTAAVKALTTIRHLLPSEAAGPARADITATQNPTAAADGLAPIDASGDGTILPLNHACGRRRA